MRTFGDVHRIIGNLSNNIYVVEEDDGLTVIDPGMPSDLRRLIDRVKSLGRSPSEVRRILLTHFHVDHAGSAAELKESSGAEVYAHGADVPYLEGAETIPSVYNAGVQGRALMLFPRTVERKSKVPALRVDSAFDDGDVLPVLGGLEVMHAPGHTPGSACLLWRDRGVLFSGDVIQNLYFFLTLPEKGFCVDFDEAGRSAARVAGALSGGDVRMICAGHGPVVTRSAGDKLRRLGERLAGSGKAS